MYRHNINFNGKLKSYSIYFPLRRGIIHNIKKTHESRPYNSLYESVVIMFPFYNGQSAKLTNQENKK